MSRAPATVALPFAGYFLLASLDAIAGVGALLPPLLGVPAGIGDGAVLAWHARELLFGYVTAVLCGFFVAALPRWAGREIGASGATILLCLWLAGRPASWMPLIGPWLVVAPPQWLTVLVSWHVVTARAWRNLKVIALLWLFAAGACASLPGGAASQGLGWRMGLAAALGLVMIIGGRVVPSLTARYCLLHGKSGPAAPSPCIEAFAAFCGAAGLAARMIDPTGPLTGFACSVAALAQVVRLTRWRGWSVIGVPSLAILHMAYAFIPFGFAAAAWGAPRSVPAIAGLHAWTVGALGCMTLAIMASMIRCRTGQSFVSSHSGTLVWILVMSSAVLRIVAAFSVGPRPWLACSAAFWIGAFALFLVDFRRTFLALALWLLGPFALRAGRT